MKVKVHPGYDEMSAATAAFVVDVVKKKPESLICLPSGDTPTGTLKILVSLARQGKVDFTRTKFVCLDEWVGMDKTDDGGCINYVFKNFFDPLEIKPNQIMHFNAKARDLNAECKKVDDFIFKNGGLDLVLVGVGINGHIGLNEPGTSPDLYCHVVDLESSTKQVAQKYFNSEKTLSQGITLGLKHILEAKSVIVIANGKKKAEIIQKIVEGPITTKVPGSILQQHKHCNLMLDHEAAFLLTNTTSIS
jgi:glucosamine-6-phosphate isomerase